MKTTHDPARRMLLRAALATGCAICLAQASQAAEAGKVSKAVAKYQDTPKGKNSCANCVNFVASNSTCKVVEGKVSPQGWCQLWVAKPAS